MTLPLLPGAPDKPELRCANPFCRRPLTKPGPGGYGPECAKQYGLTPPPAPPFPKQQQTGPDLFDAARAAATTATGSDNRHDL